jgi:hypothetical protein
MSWRKYFQRKAVCEEREGKRGEGGHALAERRISKQDLAGLFADKYTKHEEREK